MDSPATEYPELAVFHSQEYRDALRRLAENRSTEPELCTAVAELNRSVSRDSPLHGFMDMGLGFLALLLIFAPIIMFGRLLNWIVGLGFLPDVFTDLLPTQIPDFIKERMAEPPLGWEISLWLFLVGFVVLLGFFLKTSIEGRKSAKPSHDSALTPIKKKKIDAAAERVREAVRRSAPKYQQPAFRCLGDFENCCNHSRMKSYVCTAALVVCYASLLKSKAE